MDKRKKSKIINLIIILIICFTVVIGVIKYITWPEYYIFFECSIEEIGEDYWVVKAPVTEKKGWNGSYTVPLSGEWYSRFLADGNEADLGDDLQITYICKEGQDLSGGKFADYIVEVKIIQ